jgi:hypothetical protein
VAVINPADRGPADTRPIYNENRLPGGPWNQYRPRGWVNAHYVAGPWLLLRADGMLVEQPGDVWAVQDPATLALSLLTPDEFNTRYAPMARD